MKLYEFSTIGTFHTHHNEDAFTSNEIADDILLIAVMDGCSMGIESHFASTLIAKILRKIAKELYFKSFVKPYDKSLSDYLEEILKRLFEELKEIKFRLMLDKEELLSTLILGIVHLQQRKAEIMVIGDGLVCCNGNFVDFEQDNHPDYLGYHLEEGFEAWLEKQQQRLSLTEIQDLSIATDGIFSFQAFDNGQYENIGGKELMNFLLIDRHWSNQENMLKKKLLEVADRFGLKPTDDLSILRLI